MFFKCDKKLDSYIIKPYAKMIRKGLTHEKNQPGLSIYKNQRWETEDRSSVVLLRLQFMVRLKEFALDAGLHIFGPKVLAKLVFFISRI